MLKKILRLADEYDMFPDTGVVLVCVSGGADSMSLLDALLELSAERGFRVAAAHFNHKLRGNESDRDEAFVINECKEYGVDLVVESGDAAAYAKENGLGIEEAARELRYEYFEAAAARLGAVRIATAHNANDLAETIIMNLTRGAGASGLSGIPPRRGIIVRPMLRISRDEVMEYITGRGLAYVEDSTNSIEDRTRNKIRHSVIPILCGINPQFIRAAVTAAELSGYDEDYLSNVADEYINANVAGMDATHKQHREEGENGPASDKNSETAREVKKVGKERKAGKTGGAQESVSEIRAPANLHTLHRAISGRVIRRLCGRPLSQKHVAAIGELCEKGRPSAIINLPGMKVCKEYDTVCFRSDYIKEPEAFEVIFPEPGGNYVINSASLCMSCELIIADESNYAAFDKTFNTFLFHVSEICGKIAVRPRRAGDEVKLSGSNCTKSLKKLFIEKRVPAAKRKNVPVISDDAGVLGVYGLGTGERARPISGSAMYKITFSDIKPEKGGLAAMKNDYSKILFTEKQIKQRVKELGAQISEDYKDCTPVLLGILKGCYVFLADLSRNIDLDCEVRFLQVSSYGFMSVSSGNVRIGNELDFEIKGRDILLIEDILDSGFTLMALHNLIMRHSPASLKICSLLDKPVRRKVQISADYVGFECPDEFVIGYGLDYAEKYRNLPFVAALKPEIYS